MTSRTRRPSILRGVALAAALTAALTTSLAAEAPAPASAASAGSSAGADAGTDVTVASFNVLGSSHTRGRGGLASGVARTGGVVRALRAHDVEVVGFQEMQADQLRSFRHRTGDAWAMYPGESGAREIDGENSLAWKRSAWEAVETRTFTIPYFHGNRRTMPMVRLRNRDTGMTAWFVNVHNPASTRGHRGSAKWRMQALRLEARLASRLHDTGVPVILTGDLNERERAFCTLTAVAPLRAARGGSRTASGCDAGNPRYVDWAFASQEVTFDHYVEDRSPIERRVSDHPIVVGDAHIPGDVFAGAVER
jgi:Endonuclease/Exonuclease/phosphatase family